MTALNPLANDREPMSLKRFFRKNTVPEQSAYAAIVAAARHPTAYARWGVPDDVDGRFDMISLHMFLALDRLKGEGADFRQRLIDLFFADMDRALREMGVGDLSVAKKVRRMAEAFYGRVAAYDAGLAEGREALTKIVSRNFFPAGDPANAAPKLADYAIAARDRLAHVQIERLLDGAIDFPEPSL